MFVSSRFGELLSIDFIGADGAGTTGGRRTMDSRDFAVSEFLICSPTVFVELDDNERSSEKVDAVSAAAIIEAALTRAAMLDLNVSSSPRDA